MNPPNRKTLSATEKCEQFCPGWKELSEKQKWEYVQAAGNRFIAAAHKLRMELWSREWADGKHADAPPRPVKLKLFGDPAK